MEERNVIGILRTLRQAKQIVWLFSVVFGFQVFVTEATGGNDYPNLLLQDAHKEAPLPGLDTCDGILLAELPATAIWIDPANTFDALMRVGSVDFVDAVDLYVSRHFGLISNPGGSAAPGMSLIPSRERDKGEVL